MKKLRIAAVADIHISKPIDPVLSEMFQNVSQEADILLLCGDLTHHGDPAQAWVLNKELEACTIPVLGVLGNHDYDLDRENEIRKILRSGKLKLIEGDTFRMEHVGFAGAKGFCGGFKEHMLTSFGERAIKDFVKESIDESMLLENALFRLQTEKIEKKVVVLHYSPISKTLQGEDIEKYLLLGSSHLEEPINNFNASIVFHGHAHHGTHFGKTSKDIPVYNVSLPVLRKLKPHQSYGLFEI